MKKIFIKKIINFFPLNFLKICLYFLLLKKRIICLQEWKTGFIEKRGNILVKLRRIIFERLRENLNFLTLPWYYGTRLFLPSKSEITRNLAVENIYEPCELKFVYQFLKRKMTFIDIGAHNGVYTIFGAKKVGEEGKVLAIEPSKREFNILRMNVRRNKLKNIKLINDAVGEKDEERFLKIAQIQKSGHNTFYNFVYEQTKLAYYQKVKIRTLDEIIEKEKIKPDLIKIDTEGSEYDILKGAQNTIKKYRPAFLIEIHKNKEEIFKLLKKYNYRILPAGQCFKILPSFKTSRRKGKFILITGIGHCGTKWLATVLNSFDKEVKFYHEYKLTVTGLKWDEALEYELQKGLGAIFIPYFDFMEELLTFCKIVGDSNSWTMLMIPEIHKRIKVDLVIYLVRNGIQNVHSCYYHNINLPEDHFFYKTFLKKYAEITGESEFDKYDKWERWCFWWKVNRYMPEWLKEKIGSDKVYVFRLEDLIMNVDYLFNIFKLIINECKVKKSYLKKMQKKDINRKIGGDRTPRKLWQKWSDEQKEKFLKICGDTMRYYSYGIP